MSGILKARGDIGGELTQTRGQPVNIGAADTPMDSGGDPSWASGGAWVRDQSRLISRLIDIETLASDCVAGKSLNTCRKGVDESGL